VAIVSGIVTPTRISKPQATDAASEAAQKALGIAVLGALIYTIYHYVA